MANIHIKRMESSLKKLISNTLNFKMRDKNLQFITITDIELTNDLSYLKIYYSHLEDDRKENVQNALDGSIGFLKNEIAKAKLMRKIPELVFKYDEVEEKARNLETIFARIHSENERKQK